jgi:hypothetical protein
MYCIIQGTLSKFNYVIPMWCSIILISMLSLPYFNFRSAAKLAVGDSAAALLDAKEACKIAPNFPQVPVN